MNRGSQILVFSGRTGDRSFNEAPIHESGKFIDLIVLALAIGGFNEAPIHESGKCSQFGLTPSRVGALQ